MKRIALFALALLAMPVYAGVTLNNQLVINLTTSEGVAGAGMCEHLTNGQWASVPVADRLTCSGTTPWGQALGPAPGAGLCTALEVTNNDPLSVLPCGVGETPPQKLFCLAAWEDLLLDDGVTYFSIPDTTQCASLIEAWERHIIESIGTQGVELLWRQTDVDAPAYSAEVDP